MLKTNKDRPFVKGFKFPIYPTDEQKVLLEKTFGCSRFVWNKALAEAIQEYEEYLILKDKNTIGNLVKPVITGFYFANKLPIFKSLPENQFLSEVSYDVLQQTLINLGSAYSDFFKRRKGYPNFKKKNASKQSFQLTKNVFRFKDNQFYIAKCKEPIVIGYGRNGKLRTLPSEPTSATISKTPSGKYYISFICEYVPVVTTGTSITGIDLGIKDFIVTSDGNKIPNPKHLSKHEKNLKRKQQYLSRCKKGSKNRNKARIKVATIHERITNQRNDFHHKLSRQLINENQVIGIESLMVKNMIKNRKLSKAISQAAWSSFTGQLFYKSKESQHCNIVKIDTFYPSSHICSHCNTKLDRKLSLADRTFECPICHVSHDRDINAAINIRNEAVRFLKEINFTDNGKLVLITRNQ